MTKVDEQNLPRPCAGRVLRRLAWSHSSKWYEISPGAGRPVGWAVWANCDMQMACYGAHIETQLGGIDDGDIWTWRQVNEKCTVS